MKCPKCKKENDDNALVCSECGFKLQLKCPYCGSYNHIGTKICKSCGKQLLKVCPSCKAINFAQAKVCRKCSTRFISKEEQIQPVVIPNLAKSACVAIELINISSIKNNIKSQELAQKVIAKFYRIFAVTAKTSNLRPLKISENTLVVNFDNSSSFLDSINDAVDFTGKLDTALDEVSKLLESKLKISYKVRYFIGTFKPHQKFEITSAIALGVVDDIIFADDVYIHLKDKMLFKEVENNLNAKYYKFLDQNDPETIVSDMPKESLIKTRTEIVNEFFNKINITKEGFVVCLNGKTGIGKSNIFNLLKMTFDEDNSRIWLTGQCPLVSKSSPLAFFKSLLQNMFDIPAFNIDIENTKNKVREILNNKLNITDTNIINHILSLIFINDEDINKPIYQNKQNTYISIATIFKSVLNNGAVVLQIEDIENIDSFSLEILRSLLDDGILKCNLKIFITSNMDIDIIQFFANAQLNKNNTYFVDYPLLTKDEIDDFIVKAIGVREELGSNILNHIYEYSENLPAFIEEFLNLLLQLGIIRFTDDNNNPVFISSEANTLSFPKTVQEIIQLRLTNISNINPNAFRTLYYASILGFKFLPAIIQNILHADNNEFQQIIRYLTNNSFIVPVDSYNYTFKNRLLWETVRNLQLSEDNIRNGVVSCMDTLEQLTSPDMASVIDNLLGINVPKYEIISKIETASKEAYILGDDYSYIYHKTLLLEAVDLSTLDNKKEIILAIKEELLNLTYKTFPEKAIKFGDDLYTYYKDTDEVKTLDILGIMSVAFEESGNYLASVECVDRALEKIDTDVNKIAGMLLYYSKITSVMQLGRFEENINIIQNNILPVLDLYFKDKTKEITTLSRDDMQYVELKSLYILALSYALNGSPKALEITETLQTKANEITNNEFILKSQLATGIIKLLQGETETIQNILNGTKESIPTSKDATVNTLIWLILKNVSAYFKGEYTEIVNELMMLANFSQNIKQFALEPVIRGLLVKIALREGHVQEAENLAYDLFYKSSNNQWALGALLNWYMYCEIAIYKENYEEAIKVAENALDVAEKANMNNIFFTSLFKLKIAQIYGLRGDYDIAKINLSEAGQLAEQNGYTYIIAIRGIISYDILLKQITINSAFKNENISLLYKYLLASQDAVEKLQNPDLSMFLKKKSEDIFNFAQENNINL